MKFSSHLVSFVVASLHVPCRTHCNSIQQIETWWEETSHMLRKFQDCSHIVCMDANAPLADECLPFTGGHQAEKQNDQGAILLAQLLDLQMVVPSTFASCHEGEGKTWKHSNGTMHRIDYVAISCKLWPWAVSSYVMQDFDHTRMHLDHLPVVLHLQGFQEGKAEEARILWDQDKLRDPWTRQQFQRSLATLPIPRWDVDADVHCQIWEEQFLQVSRQFFERSKTTKPVHSKRPKLSETTLNLISFKRQVLSMARSSTGLEYEEYKMHLREIEREVRSRVFKDHQVWYDNLITSMQQAGELHDSAAVFRTLRRLGSKNISGKRRPLPMLRSEDGSLASSHLEVQTIFQRQFAKVEAGQIVSEEELKKHHFRPEPVSPMRFDQDALITPWEIGQAISKMKRGKMPGANQITADLLKCAGDVATMHLLPLFLKCTVHCYEPFAWKGGTLVALFKGKGHVQSPQSYGSIFISNTTGKTFHSCLRGRLQRAWIRAMDALQMGGRPGFGTDIAHHTANLFLSWARASKTPAALAFVDLTAAFYSILRQGLFAGEVHDAHLCFALQSLGVSPSELQEIISTIESEAAILGVSEHVTDIVQGLFQASHFRMKGLPDLVHTTKGTRPGDPVADLLFNMTMSLIQRAVRRQLALCGIQDVAKLMQHQDDRRHS